MSDHAASKPYLGSKSYDTIRNAALVYLPGLATLYFTIAQITGLPYAEEVVGIIAAVTVFLGITTKVSKSNYNASPENQRVTVGPPDGEVVITTHEDGDSFLFKPDTDLEGLKSKDSVTLKVVRKSE